MHEYSSYAHCLYQHRKRENIIIFIKEIMKIVDAFKAGKYQVLIVERIEKDFHQVEIDGVIYDVVTVYDIPNAVAIESDCNFIGKNITFL